MSLNRRFVYAENGRYWSNNGKEFKKLYDPLEPEIEHKMRLLDAAADSKGEAHITDVGHRHIDPMDNEVSYEIHLEK